MHTHLLCSSKAKEPADGDCASLARNLAILEVPHKDGLQVTHGVVVVLNELREAADATRYVHGRGWVRHVQAREEGLETLVGLELLGHALHEESPCVKGLGVLGGAEVGMPEAYHGTPVDIYEEHDQASYAQISESKRKHGEDRTH
jgi:hypothetical protein